ncbi:Fic family protein [Nitrospira sp. M1]
MSYNWEQKDWPEFQYDLTGIEDVLLAFAEKTGLASGILKALPEDMRTEAVIEMMASEAVKTSEIEGEILSRKDVMSSIRKNLGLGDSVGQVPDKRAEGAARLMIDVRDSFAEPLTKEKLFSWHWMVMTSSRGIMAGAWRTHSERMQVISGPIGKEKVHFEAPPSNRVPKEMTRFIRWFNTTGPGGKADLKNPLVRAAICHLYFESIHPFEDGNGRIGRALSEKALSQGVGRPVVLSLSRVIEAHRKQYYAALQKGQLGNEITEWVNWFANVVFEAQNQAEEHIEFTLKKTKLFDRFKTQLNERQLKVLRRMLEEGPNGFEGGMNAKKYMAITDTSKATATRDLQDLVDKDVFNPIGGGRSTRYAVKL